MSLANVISGAAADILELITEFGQSMTYRAITTTREAGGSNTSSATKLVMTGVLIEDAAQDVDALERRTARAFFRPQDLSAPKIGDVIEIGGVPTWYVDQVKAIPNSQHVAVWRLDLRDG